MARDPVESVSTCILALLPKRMMDPSPNCLVIEDRASSMFLSRPASRVVVAGVAGAALAGAALDMVVRGIVLRGGAGQAKAPSVYVFKRTPMRRDVQNES